VPAQKKGVQLDLFRAHYRADPEPFQYRNRGGLVAPKGRLYFAIILKNGRPFRGSIKQSGHRFWAKGC
jgi:hypothetical protein